MSALKKMVSKTNYFGFVKYASAILLVSTTIFFVGHTTQLLVITIEIVKPTKKIAVLTNKIAEVYFTNRSSWFY